MSLAYFYHPACLEHKMGMEHPECPPRIQVIEDQMMAAQIFDFVSHYEAPRVTKKQLRRVHMDDYIDNVLSYVHLPDGEHRYLDPDTMITNKTPEAALRAAGAVVEATELVFHGKHPAAFCCVRPPGHHALADQAMGFCFFNNVAVAAKHALDHLGLHRVAVVDFDVHHGNGTDDMFRNEPRAMLCSTFQHPFYPFSGTETNQSNIVNVPLQRGEGSDKFRQAVVEHWLPALHKFRPEMIFISAGFDAHIDDDMSHIRLYDRDYAWVTEEIMHIADRYAQGRIVSTLEGGYDLPSLGRAAVNHLRVLMHMS